MTLMDFVGPLAVAAFAVACIVIRAQAATIARLRAEQKEEPAP